METLASGLKSGFRSSLRGLVVRLPGHPDHQQWPGTPALRSPYSVPGSGEPYRGLRSPRPVPGSGAACRGLRSPPLCSGVRCGLPQGEVPPPCPGVWRGLPRGEVPPLPGSCSPFSPPSSAHLPAPPPPPETYILCSPSSSLDPSLVPASVPDASQAAAFAHWPPGQRGCQA